MQNRQRQTVDDEYLILKITKQINKKEKQGENKEPGQDLNRNHVPLR